MTWIRVAPFIHSLLLQTTLLLLNVLKIKAVPQGSQQLFCVLYVPNLNIINVRSVVRDSVVTLQ